MFLNWLRQRPAWLQLAYGLFASTFPGIAIMVAIHGFSQRTGPITRADLSIVVILGALLVIAILGNVPPRPR